MIGFIFNPWPDYPKWQLIKDDMAIITLKMLIPMFVLFSAAFGPSSISTGCSYHHERVLKRNVRDMAAKPKLWAAKIQTTYLENQKKNLNTSEEIWAKIRLWRNKRYSSSLLLYKNELVEKDVKKAKKIKKFFVPPTLYPDSIGQA